jgi:molybdenum cofactor biosynthesis protein B
VPSVSCAVITVSDSRTPRDDTSGRFIRDALLAAGHEVYAYEIMRDEPSLIAERLRQLIEDRACMAVLLTGGTGLALRDQTFEAVSMLLERTLEGFGELFRMLSFKQIGPMAMLSRAVAGVADETLIFSMPGAPAAVELAMEELILPALGHAVALLRGSPPAEGGRSH